MATLNDGHFKEGEVCVSKEKEKQLKTNAKLVSLSLQFMNESLQSPLSIYSIVIQL